MPKHKYKARVLQACQKCTRPSRTAERRLTPSFRPSSQCPYCDGTVVFFASTGEYKRFMELWVLQRAGLIHDLTLQPSFNLAVNDHHICRYVADYTYTEAGKTVVEDFKGVRTKVFDLKAKLMLAIHGIKIFISK